MSKIISLFQYNPIVNNPEANLRRIVDAVSDASKIQSKLCIFPEDFLFGALRERSDIIEAAKTAPQYIIRLQNVATKLGVQIIPGSYPTFVDGKLYNSTCFINENGEVSHRYSKHNLWLSERDGYTASSENLKVFDSVLGKTVLLICWDLMDHRLFDEAVYLGCEWIICIALWSNNQSKQLREIRGKSTNRYPGYSDSKALDLLISSRAVEYNVGMVFCNIGGWHEYRYDEYTDVAKSAGHSQIVTPSLNILGKIGSRKENTIHTPVVDIKTEIEDFERFYGRREDVMDRFVC